MSGQKALGRVAAEQLARTLNQLLLGASCIGDERGWRDKRRNRFQLRQDATDRSGQNHDIAADDGALQIGFRAVDGAARLRDFQYGPFVAADDCARETGLFQSKPQRAAD